MPDLACGDQILDRVAAAALEQRLSEIQGEKTEYAESIRIGQSLEGLNRQAGVHAAGIVITGGSAGVVMFPNTAMPATYDAAPQTVSSGTSVVESLCSGDLNNDGLEDFVYALNGDAAASLKVGLQLASGSESRFATSVALPATGVRNLSRAVGRNVKMADMDGDGFLDIIAAINGADATGEAGKGALVYLRNTGNGITYETTYIDESLAGVGLVQVMDLDGDQRLDIAVLGVNSKKLAVYFNEGGSGAVGNFTKVVIDEAAESNLCMATGDFNNAGQGDILAIGKTSIHFYLNYYQRNFQKWDMFSVLATNATGTSTDYHHYACDLYDMDGNGLTDIVYTQGLQNASGADSIVIVC
ncbi:MAG: hypothetical protein HC936_12815 [Leptolyngbyaceae cyanobacterium SU_3_3]|nr:hypothetical protein [Leptolyngbyaceae cyanobacterium SU_3_3]